MHAAWFYSLQTMFGFLQGVLLRICVFLLGNQLIHLITDYKDQELRVDLEDHEGMAAYAAYGTFKVASQNLKFALTIGNYHGTAGWHLHHEIN